MGCRKLHVNDYFRMTDSASGTDVPYYALADANKNITEYFDTNGSAVAHYDYSPFGKITQSIGTMASDFDYRFSSEVFDNETGLVYYNFRYYSSELGRWLSRDPAGESKGGPNPYWMVANNPIKWWDRWGLGWTHSITPFSADYSGLYFYAFFVVDIEYTSDDPCCLEWKLIQYANFQIGDLTVSPNPEDNDNFENYPWTGWQGDDITEDGWFLDHGEDKPPYLPGQTGGPNTGFWSWLPWADDTQPATLDDTPGWPSWPYQGWLYIWPKPWNSDDTEGKIIKMMFDIYAMCTKCKCHESGHTPYILSNLYWEGTVTNGNASVTLPPVEVEF